MSLKKYLISIEDNDSERLKKFYQQQIFNTYRSEFIKFGVKGKNLSQYQYHTSWCKLLSFCISVRPKNVVLCIISFIKINDDRNVNISFIIIIKLIILSIHLF